MKEIIKWDWVEWNLKSSSFQMSWINVLWKQTKQFLTIMKNFYYMFKKLKDNYLREYWVWFSFEWWHRWWFPYALTTSSRLVPFGSSVTDCKSCPVIAEVLMPLPWPSQLLPCLFQEMFQFHYFCTLLILIPFILWSFQYHAWKWKWLWSTLYRSWSEDFFSKNLLEVLVLFHMYHILVMLLLWSPWTILSKENKKR